MSQLYDMSQFEKEPEALIGCQTRGKHKTLYFCRLCGSYTVPNPKVHLRDKHGADYRRTQNKAYTDIIKCLFSRCI
jgi:hypothetical protein